MSFDLQGFLLPEIRNPFPGPILPCRYPPLPEGTGELDFEGLIPLGIGSSGSCCHDPKAHTLLVFSPSEAFSSTTVASSFLEASSYALQTCPWPQQNADPAPWSVNE